MGYLRQSWLRRSVVAVVLGLGIGIAVLSGMSTLSYAKENREAPVPLAWVTADDKIRFEEGRRLFEFEFTPRDGLGPLFNARACAACHHVPSIGGHGPGYRGNIRFVEGTETAGRLFHDKSIAGGPAELLPDNARLSKRKPPTLLGLGLVEAIPEEAILAHADPEDRDGDGIRGRPAMRDGHLLRFGSQAHVGSLFEFVADALRQEMGLTSTVRGFERETAAVELPFRFRQMVPEPNVSRETVRKLVDFVALLAPPPRETLFTDYPSVQRGERLFGQLAAPSATCRRSGPAPSPSRERETASRFPILPSLIEKSPPIRTFSCMTSARR